MTTLNQWINDYKTSRPHERLGQAFVNDFIKGTWPELFYQKNDDVALEMIKIWLKDICTYPFVPQKIDREYQAARSSFFYGKEA